MTNEYDEILKLLKERILEKHEQYGLSYLEETFGWLKHRLTGEIQEMDGELFSPHLSGDNAIIESLDVAVCALLIADKKRREKSE
jgi:hypothetical protein